MLQFCDLEDFVDNDAFGITVQHEEDIFFIGATWPDVFWDDDIQEDDFT